MIYNYLIAIYNIYWVLLLYYAHPTCQLLAGNSNQTIWFQSLCLGNANGLRSPPLPLAPSLCNICLLYKTGQRPGLCCWPVRSAAHGTDLINTRCLLGKYLFTDLCCTNYFEILIGSFRTGKNFWDVSSKLPPSFFICINKRIASIL